MGREDEEELLLCGRRCESLVKLTVLGLAITLLEPSGCQFGVNLVESPCRGVGEVNSVLLLNRSQRLGLGTGQGDD